MTSADSSDPISGETLAFAANSRPIAQRVDGRNLSEISLMALSHNCWLYHFPGLGLASPYLDKISMAFDLKEIPSIIDRTDSQLTSAFGPVAVKAGIVVTPLKNNVVSAMEKIACKV
jgi:hypothetical protein